MKRRVIILFGGRSAEHEVSVKSAASVMNAIDLDRFVLLPVGISKCGRWQDSLDPREILSSGKSAVPEPPYHDYIGPIARILSAGDVVFPILHGPFGEDGSVQGLLEMVDIPYVGAGVMGSALGMDKVFQKTVYRQTGIPVVDFVWRSSYDYEHKPAEFLLEVEQVLGYPCFVKPANMGSSVGISKAVDRESLKQAICLALRYDSKVLVEKGVNAREIECSVMGNDEPTSSLPGEIIPNAEFYDYTAKYEQPSTLHVPAILTPQQIVQIQRLAVRAYKAIDCAGLARVDFFLKPSGTIYVNEVNTMPGFTNVSMYPKMWEATGLCYTDLITKLITLAFAKYEQKRRISVNFRE